MKCNQQTAH